METTEMTLALPMGNIEKAQQLCAYINGRKSEILKEIEAADAALTDENAASKETAAELKRLDGIIEDLRDKGKKLVEEACALTEAQRVLTAIDSRLWSFSSKADPNCAYAVLSDALKNLKAKVKDIKERQLPKTPVRAIPVVLYATDKGFNDLCKKIKDGKLGGVTGWQVAPDEAAEKKAVKIIEG